MSDKSPAFSFYAKDWLTATLTWALDARGAYATLLAYQWDAGSVPGDDLKALAKLLGVNQIRTRAVWAVIAHKFDRQANGTWLNARLEEERQKQSDRRAALAENGRGGGRPKNQKDNQTETNRFSEPKPNVNLTESLPSSSAFPSSDLDPLKNGGSREPRPRARTTGNGANEPGSLPRDHMHHSMCGPSLRVCLTVWQCGVLMQAYGGPPELQKAAVKTFVDLLDKSLGPDDAPGAFSDVEKNFKTWMKSIGRTPFALKPNEADTDAEMIAMLEADSAERKGRLS